MNEIKSYFLSGVGGSGMAPLAALLRARGHRVAGSDRAFDNGLFAEKQAYLRSLGVEIHRQDGSGVTEARQIVVASSAVESAVPDLVAARAIGASIVLRAELLAELFNAAQLSIGVAGTSGKSTTTAMAGWILDAAGRDPTIVNGAVMANYARAGALFASARVGTGDAFVSELDESDGTIALYKPNVAILNNIALDHKSMDELRRLFTDYLARARIAVVNLDNAEAARIAPAGALTYGIDHPSARLAAHDVQPEGEGVAFAVEDRADGARARVLLRVPGRHNVSNALAAIGAARACGVDLAAACDALSTFSGVRRRLETVGTANGVTIIDDFAHNPDKIAASLSTLHEKPGRLLVFFQPHGFGPLRLMRRALVDMFASTLNADDALFMFGPVYFGGSAVQDVWSGDIADDLNAIGRPAEAYESRETCGDRLVAAAKPGDRIVIMGARDDTLTEFARSVLGRVGARVDG